MQSGRGLSRGPIAPTTIELEDTMNAPIHTERPRSSHLTSLEHPLLCLAWLVLFSVASAGQTELSGVIHDGLGGPLLTGQTYEVTANLTVPAGQTLTVEAGVTVLFNGSLSMNVFGMLDVNGVADDRVTFTSVTDVSGSPVPGDWRGVMLESGGVVEMAFTDMRYGGNASHALVFVSAVSSGTTVSLESCSLSDCQVSGLDLGSQSFNSLSVVDCTFDDNGEFGVARASLDLLPSFSNNTAIGNSSGDYIEMRNGLLPAGTDLVVTLDQLLNEILVMNESITVPVTSSLTLPAGLVLKLVGARSIIVGGTLTAVGLPLSPIVITSIHDDAVAGDTNKDGAATTAAPGDWRNVVAQANSTVQLERVELAFGGDASSSLVAVSGDGSSLTLTECVLRDSGNDGLDLALKTFSSLSVSGCRIDDNGELAVARASLVDLPGFSSNTASGNADGDYMAVDEGDLPPTTDLVVTLDELINDILVLTSGITIPATSSLTLPAGLVVKLGASDSVLVDGALEVAGSPELPVVFTSIKDDEVAGDTNKDAALTTPAAGNWRGFRANAGGSLDVRHTVLRYGGGSSSGSVNATASAAQVDLRAVRVEHGSNDGFVLHHADSVSDCVAWDCAQDGFALEAGSFDLARCTAVANGRFGVNKDAGHAGHVISTVCWDNATDNTSGLVSGDLLNSLGDPLLAGTDGNVHTDPLFVDEQAGDLRLTSTSICVDNGDPSDQPSGLDLAGFPRFLDGTLNGNRRVDMGAYEFDNIEISVAGTPSPGSTINLVMDGTPGMTTWVFLGVATFALPFKRFGLLMVDISQPSVLFNSLPLPTSLPLAIPLDFPVGLPVFAQTLGLDGTQPSDAGNMSNRLTITVE
jgi:hypothetical protein